MTMNEFDLTGKVAVVTGAGQGIGEGIAKSMARAGASVVVAARSVDKLNRVAREIQDAGGNAIAVPTDVTDRAALVNLAEVAIREFGGLHCWVNNAGGSPVRSALNELPDDEWQTCIDLNLTSVWKGSVIAFEYMKEGGSIIQISSPAGDRAVPGSGHYGAAKAAVNSLTKTLSLEFAPAVTVNGISPGYIPTEVMMTALQTDEAALAEMADARIPLKRLGTPKDIGSAAVYLASEAGSWVTGQTLIVAGGM
ncbi:MAG: NAD(P)-dependent dehydrogenase (short-subunit alcohol dehydrogenase family) [Candidatus Azotimanducaceae bacterium]|jgi:NAD(P)-dependent dehydrogenase (short-subunit alcohol dehydrogenase family)